jgi:hypothetical protein
MAAGRESRRGGFDETRREHVGGGLLLTVLFILLVMVAAKEASWKAPRLLRRSKYKPLAGDPGRLLDVVVSMHRDDTRWLDPFDDEFPTWRVLLHTRDDPSNPDNVAP